MVRTVARLLGLVLVFFLISCGDSPAPTSTSPSNTNPAVNATATPVVLVAQPTQAASTRATTGASVATVTPEVSPTPSAEMLEMQAETYFNSGDFATAEKIYSQLAQQDPQNYDYLLNLARTQAAQGKIRDAIATLEKASKLDPNDPTALYILGRLHQSTQNFAASIPPLEKVVQIQPESAEARYYLGMAYFREKQYTKAVAAFREVTRLAPDNPLAYGQLALVLFEDGKFEESEKAYLEAIKLEPDNGSTYNNLAYLYIEIGRFDEAREPIRQAEALGEGGQEYFEQTKLGLLIPDGQKEEASGNLDKAAELYLKAAEAENTLGYYYLGKLEQNRQKFDEAAAALKKYLSDGRMPDLKRDAEARLKQMGKA
jgi:tetratricopeptide (TPR) repeat protein